MLNHRVHTKFSDKPVYLQKGPNFEKFFRPYWLPAEVTPQIARADSLKDPHVEFMRYGGKHSFICPIYGTGFAMS